MKIDLDILTGVAVPVFALSVTGPRPVLAWNAGMVTMTGTPADKALGFSPKAVFGPGAAALMTADQPGNLFLEGLGTVSVILQGGLLVGTLTDHERDTFIGLAAQDLRAPLRTIHQLAVEAERDGVLTHPAMARIRRIARQGMSMTQDVVTCAEAGSVAVSGFRKVAVASLCRALLQAVHVEDIDLVVMSPATVIAEKPLMQAALRCVFEYLLLRSGSSRPTIEVDISEAKIGFRLGVTCKGLHPDASARRFLEGGPFHGHEGYGLLGLRRLVRSRGGQIGISERTQSEDARIELTLPGCVILAGAQAGGVCKASARRSSACSTVARRTSARPSGPN